MASETSAGSRGGASTPFHLGWGWWVVGEAEVGSRQSLVLFCRSRGGRHIVFYPTLKVRVGRP